MVSAKVSAMSLRMRSVLLTVISLLALLGTGTAQAAPVAAPAGFSPTQLVGPFASDIPAGGTYLPELNGFETLRKNNPALMRTNLNKVIAINNAATKAQQADALAIDHEDRLLSLSAALGTNVGAAFRKLLADDKLPKVAQLAEGDLARAGIPLQHTLIEKQIYDNPRPFVVAPKSIKRYNLPGSDLYAELADNGSYPSGHTNMGYWKGALLAYWLPELGPQIIARAGEIGRSRMVLGVHYPLDVMGGRIMATVVASSRLTDPAFAKLIDAAGVQLRTQLRKALGKPLAQAIAADKPYLTTAQAVAEHRQMMTYGFARIAPKQVNQIPAAAASLLATRFPNLTNAQRLEILRRTAIPAGYPLDQSGANGGWLRIDLAAAYAATP